MSEAGAGAGIDEVGGRLRAALVGVLGTLPEPERTGEALSTRYAIDGAGARRVVRATRAETDAEVLARAPGIKALRKLAQSAGDEELASVTEAFDALIRAHGKSKAELTRVIREARDAKRDS
ncbi:MAG: hypothetical protein AAGI30_12750 [Planctomycetota bacterium]